MVFFLRVDIFNSVSLASLSSHGKEHPLPFHWGTDPVHTVCSGQTPISAPPPTPTTRHRTPRLKLSASTSLPWVWRLQRCDPRFFRGSVPTTWRNLNWNPRLWAPYISQVKRLTDRISDRIDHEIETLRSEVLPGSGFIYPETSSTPAFAWIGYLN